MRPWAEGRGESRLQQRLWAEGRGQTPAEVMGREVRGQTPAEVMDRGQGRAGSSRGHGQRSGGQTPAEVMGRGQGGGLGWAGVGCHNYFHRKSWPKIV